MIFQLNEVEHNYGENVHILDNPVLSCLLLELSLSSTVQPRISWLLENIYNGLINTVVNREFPVRHESVLTRMSTIQGKKALVSGELLNRDVQLVIVNMATAGDQPANIIYNWLNYIFNPSLIRQDHLMPNRTVGNHGEITGCDIAGCKIGGEVEGAIMLLPDPMGATGGTVEETIDIYKGRGEPEKIIAMHLVITPEYIRKVKERFPTLVVYAVRLDRGLSSPEVLKTLPGTDIQNEVGLNANGYIVPGLGGMGELINNREK
ncbi:uracil phosphoribosyltransferase [Patescibacteria group bacterium]